MRWAACEKAAHYQFCGQELGQMSGHTHNLTPKDVRKIRNTLEMSRTEFGRILWAAVTTVEQWESGECKPVGLHRRMLVLLERALSDPGFKPFVRDPRASDPLFVLYRVLEPLYGSRSDNTV
jgi:DNA-binding transcriptional regulator YiaG